MKDDDNVGSGVVVIDLSDATSMFVSVTSISFLSARAAWLYVLSPSEFCLLARLSAVMSFEEVVF